MDISITKWFFFRRHRFITSFNKFWLFILKLFSWTNKASSNYFPFIAYLEKYSGNLFSKVFLILFSSHWIKSIFVQKIFTFCNFFNWKDHGLSYASQIVKYIPKWWSIQYAQFYKWYHASSIKVWSSCKYSYRNVTRNSLAKNLDSLNKCTFVSLCIMPNVSIGLQIG